MALRVWTTTLVLALALGGAATAGPRDAKVGETLAVFKKDGTPLRQQPQSLSTPVASLPSGTRIFVREVRQPWLRVMALDQSRQEGWVRATETTDPAALQPDPGRPAHLRAPSERVNQRDISVAGRQFNASVERRYRRAQPNLEAAYARVDAMEAAIRTMDPAESIAFITEGNLGQAGQDYARPPLAPPTPASAQPSRQEPRRPRGGVGGLLGRIPGVGDKIPKELKDGLGAAAEVAPGLFKQLSERFTPEQEYFLGRAVAANAIAQFGVDPDESRRAYVRKVGDAVVRLSRRLKPTAGGYFFEVLDSDEINGLSGPGGFVLITRGAVNMCRDEEELAAILAHELGHITYKHGEATLRKGKDFQATLGALARVGASAGGIDDNQLANKLLEVFTKAVGQMARTAVENDYGRAAEFQADLEGTYLLMDVVYDHRAMSRSLGSLARHTGAYRRSATHAPPAVRAQNLLPIVQRYPNFPYGEQTLEIRNQRFHQATAR